MDFVANDQEIGLGRYRVYHPLNLINAVQFMIDRAGNGQARVEAFEDGRHFCFVEVIQEDTGGRRSAIHHHDVAFEERVHHAVYVRRMVGVNETDFRMEPFEGRVFVITVEGRMADMAVFEVLDEVDGEEAFADAAFAVEDEVEPFHVL